MKLLERAFLLLFTAVVTQAQNSKPEDTLLYDTSGSSDYVKVGGKIPLKEPLHFYDETFKTVYAHKNGYVTFADEKVWIPGYFRDSKVMAPCMVEIQDNNNLGVIRFLVTSEEHQLNRAKADVYAHFANEADFKARQVIIIEWNGLLSEETTIQNVIIIGKEKTFALFLFKNKNGNSISGGITSLDAQSGFSSGDKVRYTELLDFRQNRGIEYLFKSSNTMVPGKWLFFVGSTNTDFFHVKMPDTYSVYDRSTGKMIRKDINECTESIASCHRFADCLNTIPGYKCACSKTYFGNGRICLSEYSLSYIGGKVRGIVNGINIGTAELDAYISKSSGGLFVSIASLNSGFGHSFQMIPPLFGLLGWLFAKDEYGKSGFNIVGNRFKSTSIIIFKTGEILYIKQEMRGFDSFNSLIFDTEVNGNLPVPLTNATSVQSIKPYTEKYTFGKNKKVYSEGSATYVVDSNSIQYNVNRLIIYENVNNDLEYEALVRVTDTVATNFGANRLLSFKQQYSIETDAKTTERGPVKPTSPEERKNEVYPTTKVKTPEIPSTTKLEQTEMRMESKTEIQTTRKSLSKTRTAAKTLKSPVLNRNAQQSTTGVPTTTPKVETTAEKAFIRTTNKKTTIRTTKEPTTLRPCLKKCSENAECATINGARKCVCKEGYIGNGTSCIVDKRISCGLYKCDENSICIKEQSQYFCQCKKGFVGDGVKCYVDVPCECHINAECYRGDAGKKICVCKLGFVGDGKRCQDIDECRDKRIMCQSNSKCVNTIGSYECLCDKGFRKNGTKCLDIPECTEQKDACGEHAICTEIPGSYKCHCPKGYHFGYRKRDCFLDCPRCLNGGTCVGKFRCECAPGYSGEICQWVGDEFLLYAQGGNIKRFSYPYGPMSYGYIYRNPENLMVAVDYDCHDKQVYWTDVTSGSIQRSNYDGSAMEVVISGLVDPQGITIDWLGRNIFWTDNGPNNIQVSSLDGRKRKVLFDFGITNPRPIVCNPYTGQLFWADWDRTKPRIEVSSMDGTGRKILVSKDIGLPNGLTIDYKAGEVCWTDAEMHGISCIGMDGRNQRQLTKMTGYPFGITMHDSMIYWTNWVTDDIVIFDKTKKKQMLDVRSGFGMDGRLFDIKSVTACPARKNVCSYDNGGCGNHLCLATKDGGRACE